MLKLIAIFLVGPLWAYVIYNYYIDLRFYRRNGWDFSKHSGAADFYPGESADLPAATPYSNERRVRSAYPRAILVLSAIFIALLFAKDII